MAKKNFRSDVCTFTKELRQRQILRGAGLAAIATLVITAHMQRIGRIHYFSSPASTQVETLPSKVSSDQSQTIDAVTQVAAPLKTQPLKTTILPLHWSIESATIQNSFTQAAHQSGLTSIEINELTKLFNKKIDFKHLHKGDRFKIITERIPSTTPHSKPIDQIIAAQFITAHKNETLVRYTNTKTQQTNYYQADGTSLGEGFLRYPTHYTRIGSGFSLNRFDPITNVYHSHPAIDFDAPIDTPIVATADGKISYIANQQGYGNVIRINHPGQILTLYAHMHHFSSGLHLGSFVKKGQVIGYVGMTGYATGPHVHYELHFGAKPVNPLTCKLPSANGIPSDQRNKFNEQVKMIKDKLNVL